MFYQQWKEKEGGRNFSFAVSHETQINAIIHEVSQRKQTHLREKSIPGKIYWKIIREFQKETRRKRQSHPRNLLQSGTRTPWICCWNLAIPGRKASILAAGKRAKGWKAGEQVKRVTTRAGKVTDEKRGNRRKGA